MLNPSGLWENLRELLLRYRFYLTRLVKNDGALAGGALVECEDVGHGLKGGSVAQAMMQSTSWRCKISRM